MNEELEQELTKAVDLVTVDLLNSLDFGEDKQLTDNFIVYRYTEEEDCVVISHVQTEGDRWHEMYQLLWDENNDSSIEFHALT